MRECLTRFDISRGEPARPTHLPFVSGSLRINPHASEPSAATTQGMSLGLHSLAATQAVVMKGLQAPGSKLTARVTFPASNASARRPQSGVVRVTAQGNFNMEVEDKPGLQTDDSGDSSEKPTLTRPPDRDNRDRPKIIRAADRRPGAHAALGCTGPRREAPRGDRDSEGL